ncbi:hypothetical protein D3C80_1874460 [compost metagenome]
MGEAWNLCGDWVGFTFPVGANSFAMQDAVLPIALQGAAALPIANEFAPTR